MRYFVDSGGGPSLEGRSRLTLTLAVTLCVRVLCESVCRSESVLCRVPLRESFVSDARCHLMRSFIPSESFTDEVYC